MKTIKRVALKEATQLSQEEMKLIFGGSGTEDECAGKPSSITCRNAKSDILKEGSGIGCSRETIVSVCNSVNWKTAICTCIAKSGTSINR